MKKRKTSDRLKGLWPWAVLGVALLVAAVLAGMLWNRPSDAAPGDRNPQNPNTTYNQQSLPDASDSTEPSAPTDSADTTEPSGGPADREPGTEDVEPGEEQPLSQTTVSPEQQLVCEDYGLFGGAFVEDGSDEPVQNVAALLVTNGSSQYLDLAKLTYELDGREAVFMVTGLPAGSSAWVLESTRMTASAETEFIHKATVTSFRADAVTSLEGVDLEFNGTMLKVTNTTDRTFKALTVYYKVLHEDGNYLGGITYMATFGDLGPGQSAEKIAGHFHPDKARVVRIGYQEG